MPGCLIWCFRVVIIMKLFPKKSNILHRAIQLKRLLSPVGLRYTHQLTELENNPCQYPPIIDPSDEGQKRHTRHVWYESLKSLPSVEEKLHELAVIQKLKLKTYTLRSLPPTYSGVNFHNYITRTHNIDGLPKHLSEMDVNNELDEIRECLCEVLLNHYNNIWAINKSKSLYDSITETNAGSALTSSLISQCFKKLATRNDYILSSTIQQRPRIFSFWWHGGYGTDKDELEERNLCFQYEDYASLAIRMKDPLLPVLDRNDSLCSTADVLDCHYHPDVFHIPHSVESKVASIPAYWPGDPYEFPFLLVLTSNEFQSLTSQLNYIDLNKIDNGAAVMSSFAWCNAVATYQGFNPFNDLTYPIVTQTLVTNGQDWNFFIYQLNTIAFHEDVDKKDRRNLCWSTGRMRLFDTIENGKVKGINDEVFRTLLKLLHNVPQFRENIIMKPYLSKDTRDLDEILHMRFLLRKKYTRVLDKMAHREEVPTWVKIYKQHPDAPPTPFIRLA